MRKLKIGLMILGSIILIMAVALIIYGNDYYKADDYALSNLISSTEVQVDENNDAISFKPSNPTKGMVIYPGGKVEASAYAPLAMELAKKDMLVVIVKMPLKLAIFNINGANKVLDKYQVDDWYIMGHSLGGSMAASYLNTYHEKFSGFIMLAAYSTNDLKNTNLNVLSIKGENDLVLNQKNYNDNSINLPLGFKEEVIMGGNHAYFGSYGNQKGDGKATITNIDQIGKTTDLIIDFIG